MHRMATYSRSSTPSGKSRAMTLRLPEGDYERLQTLAEANGKSMNLLLQEQVHWMVSQQAHQPLFQAAAAYKTQVSQYQATLDTLAGGTDDHQDDQD